MSLVIAGCIAALPALVGCPGDAATPTLASATGRYDAGQYALALTESEAVIARGPSGDKAQAELVAGMASFQLERFDEAERHFVAATRSDMPGIRGRARVMLAHIRLEQGRTGDAASLFDAGAADLSGSDADKARRYASLARDGQLGAGQTPATSADSTAVVVHASPEPPSPAVTPAKAAASDTPAAQSTAPRPAAPQPVTRTAAQGAPAPTAKGAPTPAARAASEDGTFTVRAGAYTTEAAAKRRAKALAADIRRAKSPEPRIAPVTTKDGDTLYAVRIGAFKSRADAEALLKRLARKDLAVGAL